MSKGFLQQTWAILLALGCWSCGAERNATVSPDGDLAVEVKVPEGGTYGEVAFSVAYNGECVLPSVGLGLETDQQMYAGNLRLESVSDVKEVTDDYRMLTGKRSHCVNHASERTYTFANEAGNRLDVTLRVYDDGVAFKYGVKSTVPGECIVDEHTAYRIPQGAKRWMQQFAVGYEGFYPLSTDGQGAEGQQAGLWSYPGLVELKDSVFLLMTEANIRRGHSGSLLCNSDSADSYKVRFFDDAFPMEETWESPWRVLMLGRLSDVVESTLVTDVSDPCAVEDTSWIQPGLASWIYWAYNHGSRDAGILKEYVDLAVDMKWPYTLIDAEWDMMHDGDSVESVLAYARQAGVKPLLWYNSSTHWMGPSPLYRLNKPENREKEFAWLNRMGVYGVKIDFFPADSIATMDYYVDLLEDAAKHRLMVNFHGAAIPRGWQRTYPHLMTVEAVYGAEWYNNNGVLTDKAAAHNATLPFTRNVIGPMDYTPGTFSDSQHPHITTHGHELALTVLFESALQHMPDRPSVYVALPDSVRQFLSVLPTAWDDTKLLSGYPGTDVVMARRKGKVWYVAGINGTDEPRTLDVPLEAIWPGEDATVSWFKDGADGRSFVLEEHKLSQPDGAHLKVDCLPRGGFVAVIK